MDKHEAAIARGEAAQRLLNDPILAEAFADVREAYLQQWEAMPTAKREAAEDIHRRLKCLRDIQTALTEHVRTGRLAAKQLAGMERLKHGARNLIDKLHRS